MARMARVVAAGVPHHITQRGNNRQDVFLLDDDRRFYLETLRERSQRHGVTLLGYCLMANHVHLVAIPERPDSLARALGGSRRPRREFGSCPRSPPRRVAAAQAGVRELSPISPPVPDLPPDLPISPLHYN